MPEKSKPDPARLRDKALAYLARREHSRFELTRKLERAGFELDDINPVLDELEEKAWLSDRRFAESWVADHQSRTGSVRLAYDLRQKGVSHNLIQAVLDHTRDSELERARGVWTKKFGSAPSDAAENNRQIRFLQSRGFTTEITRLALSARDDD